MALSDTIATIISRSKSLEICDTLHDVQNATSEEQLIEAALPLAVYAYQAGIVDDALLSDLTEATLNTYDVFTTGTYTITNPTQEVYILKGAVVNITLSGTSYVKINVMGGGQLNLIAGNTSYATVKIYDSAIVTITINDEAMVNVDTKETCQLTATVNNGAIMELIGHDNSETSVTSNNTAYVLAKMFQQSTIAPANNDTSIIDIKLFQSAQTLLT